jgi:hypothetical protein
VAEPTVQRVEGRVALDGENEMPTVIVTNPLRALQVDNQRLHRENLALKREVEALRQELAERGENGEVCSGNTATQLAASPPAVVPAGPPPQMFASGSMPPFAAAVPLAAPPQRATPRQAAGLASRQIIHLTAADGQVRSSPRPNRADRPVANAPRSIQAGSEALDDAAERFRLLELD